MPKTPAREVVIRTHAYTPPSTTLRAESDLVESGLTVRDSRGRTVAGLHASDFEVFDNGVRQQITAFSELTPNGQPGAPAILPASDKPSETVPAANVPAAGLKFVTFFFDDFHMGNGEMLFVKRAAQAFIGKGLKPADKMSIVTTSGQGDLDFTNDAKLFAGKLDHLAPHNRYVVPSYCGVSAIDSYIFLHNLDGQIVEEAIGAAMNCAGCSNQDTPAIVPGEGLWGCPTSGQFRLGTVTGAIARHAHGARLRREEIVGGERNAHTCADLFRVPATPRRAA